MVAACPLPWPRGTPIRVHRMAEALTARGHTVDVVSYGLGDPSVPVPYAIHRTGAPRRGHEAVPGPSLRKLAWLDPLLVVALGRLLRHHPYDVIHAHHYEGLLVALIVRLLGACQPIVYDSHTLLASELPHYGLGHAARAVGRALDRRLPRRADAVIAVTRTMRAWLVDGAGVDAGRCWLISNGVEFRHFATSNGIRPESGLFRIAYAGNLADYQGIELLLNAFAYIHGARPSARLELLGPIDLGRHATLAERLGIRGAIDLEPGDYASLPARLASADVLVNPRTACDGIPQKLLNYMAVGRPIVSFAGSAAPLHHGQTALLVEDGDVDAFGRAVLQLMDEPELGARLAAEAQRRVRAEHDWTAVAAQVEQVYAALLASSPPALAPAA